MIESFNLSLLERQASVPEPNPSIPAPRNDPGEEDIEQAIFKEGWSDGYFRNYHFIRLIKYLVQIFHESCNLIVLL